jgi:hypothetical protein
MCSGAVGWRPLVRLADADPYRAMLNVFANPLIVTLDNRSRDNGPDRFRSWRTSLSFVGRFGKAIWELTAFAFAQRSSASKALA